jgi:TPR repeat protein
MIKKNIKYFCIVLVCVISIIILLYFIFSQTSHRGLPLGEKEVGKLIEQAEKGDAEACWCLYLYYQEDDKESDYWQQKGAGYGDLRLLHSLAISQIYAERFNSKSAAMNLLKDIALKGHVPSQRHLAECYTEGKYIKKDLKLAKYWYQKAAQSGSKWSMSEYSEFLLKNHNDKKSLIEAYKWAELEFMRYGTGSNFYLKEREDDLKLEKSLGFTFAEKKAKEKAKLLNDHYLKKQAVILKKAKHLGYDINEIREKGKAMALKEEKTMPAYDDEAATHTCKGIDYRKP